jgi:hypothetical protein
VNILDGESIVDDGFDLESLGHSVPNDWLDEQLKHLPTTEIDIIKYGSPIKENDSCVYFLLKSNQIIYVGECINFRRRMNNHNSKKAINYDGYVCFYDVPDTARLAVEAFYIRLLSTKHNILTPLVTKSAKAFIEGLKVNV